MRKTCEREAVAASLRLYDMKMVTVLQEYNTVLQDKNNEESRPIVERFII